MIYDKNRQTELLIDLDAIEYNYRQIQSKIPDKKILPVLKASGYGIGAKTVKQFIDKMNLDIIATALVDEGVVLRAGLNYNGDIVVLNQPSQEDITNIVKYDITTGVCYEEFIEKLNKEAEDKNKKAKIHIELETGMGRTGVQLSNLNEFMEKAITLKNIEIEGVYSHFATSDTDVEYAKEQIKIFNKGLDIIRKYVSNIKYIHIGNSAGILQFSDLPGNMVRPGIMLYGYLPDDSLKGKIDLKPCTVLKSKISFMKKLEKGKSISYGRKYITNKESIIANVPIGYADGIRRCLSNNGYVVVNGEKAPIVGTICMDSFMIDVTSIENVKIGDTVYIWDNKTITLEDVARRCNTINYEILCTVSNRVKRNIIR